MRTKLSILATAALLAAVSGCGDSREKAVEKEIERTTGEDAEVQITDQGMTIRGTSEGEQFTMSMGDATRIPDDFPRDVHVFKPSRPLAAMKAGEGWSLSLQTASDAQDVLKTYQAKMSASGWAVDQSMDMGGQSVMVFSKGERVANLMVTPDGGNTQIALTVVDSQ